MEIVKIGIMSSNEMQEYTIAVAKGEIKLEPDTPKIFFASVDALYNRLGFGSSVAAITYIEESDE